MTPRHPYTVGARCAASPRGGAAQGPAAGSTPSRAFARRRAPGSPAAAFADRCALADDCCCRTERSRRCTSWAAGVSRCHYHERGAVAAARARLRSDGDPPSAAPAIRAGPCSKIDPGSTRRIGGDHAVRAVKDVSLTLRAPAGPWAWSASPAAARRRSPGCCSACCPPDAGGSIDARRPSAAGRCSKRAPDAGARALQIVFQNPDSRPQPLARHQPHHRPRAGAGSAACAAQRSRERLEALSRSVRLDRALSSHAKPRQLSGGLKQRVAIARAFAGGAAHRRLRRADLGARRLGAGGDPQPARRSAGRPARQLPLHLARPRRGALPVRHGRPCSISGG